MDKNKDKDKSTNAVVMTLSNKGVARITLNKPELHNAFDDRMINDLTNAIRKADENPSVRILIINANGASFSAGADLNWMKRMATFEWEENYQDSLKLAGLMQALHDCQKMTLALIQGAAFGGGVGLAACCDLVLASEKAYFCLSEVKLGLIPAVISPYVVKAIGERNAKRYFATGEKFNAAEAKAIQLVHKVVPHDKLNDYTEDFINRVLANGPKAMREAKTLVNYVVGKPITEGLVLETAQRIADIRASSEGREGVIAFLEKRPANWAAKNISEF